MRIEDLFKKKLSRPINGVVKVDQQDDATVWQELDEYVVTRELDGHLNRFFSASLAAISTTPRTLQSPGGWVCGYPVSLAQVNPTSLESCPICLLIEKCAIQRHTKCEEPAISLTRKLKISCYWPR